MTIHLADTMEPTTQNLKKPTGSPVTQAAGVVSGIVAFLIGRYAGFALVIPAVIIGLVWVAGRKVVLGPRKTIYPAFSVQAGHVGWMVLGTALTGQFSAVLDILVLGVLLGWLLASPRRGLLWTLIVVQAVSLLVNAYEITQAEVGTSPHKALTVHIALRVVAIALNLIALRGLRTPGGSSLSEATDTPQSLPQ